jgi:hypothetical protein
VKYLGIAQTEGGAAATVVLSGRKMPELSECVRTVREQYGSWCVKGVVPTKVVLLAGLDSDMLECRFLQVQPKQDGSIRIHTQRDCINSTVAALTRFALESGLKMQSARNLDTGLTVTMDGESILVCPSNSSAEDQVPIPLPGHLRRGWLVRLNNPYLILGAESVLMDQNDLLSATGKVSESILHAIQNEVLHARKWCGALDNSDLPKLAFICRLPDRIVARTIYLGDWHPGLPLTGTCSIAVLAAANRWYGADRLVRIQAGPNFLTDIRREQTADARFVGFRFASKAVIVYD